MLEIIEFLRGLFAFAGYLDSKTVFPKPLTREEEEECLRLCEAGDEKAREKLIECNLRLVAHISKKYVGQDMEQEDIISIGTIGLIKGINTFRSSKGTQLATYIARCIENEILMYVRSLKKIKGRVSLGDTVGTDKEGNDVSLMELLSSDESSVFEQVELKLRASELMEAIFKKLTDREKTVIMLRYGLGGHDRYTQREIARALGISRSYV